MPDSHSCSRPHFLSRSHIPVDVPLTDAAMPARGAGIWNTPEPCLIVLSLHHENRPEVGPDVRNAKRERFGPQRWRSRTYVRFERKWQARGVGQLRPLAAHAARVALTCIEAFVDSGQGEGCVCCIQGGHHELGRLPTTFRRLSTFRARHFRSAEPGVVAGQVVTADPALHHSGFLVACVLDRHGDRFLRDLVHDSGIRRACSTSTSG